MNFVHSAWKSSYAKFRPARLWWDDRGHVTRYVQMPYGAYFAAMGGYIERLLSDGAIQVAVSDQPGLVLGFIAAAPPLIHYIYVAKPFRRFGIARQMCERAGLQPEANVTFCNWTPWIENIKLPPTWAYNEVSKW